jgi:DNA mismatch repair protein MutS
MERPWASASAIRATQDSLSFILAKRDSFDDLPTNFVTNRVEHYLRDVLPTVEHDNLFEFALSAVSSWASRDRYYFRILVGVKVTCKLVHTLRRFTEQLESMPSVGELTPLLDELRTLLARQALALVPTQADSLGFWRTLRLNRVFRVPERKSIRRLLTIAYEIDALVAMADTTQENTLVIPRVDEGALHVRAEDLVHPLIEKPVANPVELDQEHRGLFLTGPNMVGKTTYLRAFATALYLAHLGMGVPARSFRFAPVQRLFSSLSLKDSLHEGVSYFRAEALRVRDIAEAVVGGYRVVAIMDEPLKGTNVKDISEASLAILHRLASKPNCMFMFSSHQIELSNELNKSADKIDCRCFTAIEHEDRLRFDFRLRTGVSSQRIGMRVLREEGVFELFDGAR